MKQVGFTHGESFVGFVNPYNFIPFIANPPSDRWKRPAHRTRPNDSGLLSGRIRLHLDVVTPLAILGSQRQVLPAYKGDMDGFVKLTLKEIEEASQDLDSRGHREVALKLGVDGLPWIPGSSIKGAARTWFEAVTSSNRRMDESPVSWRATAVSRDRRLGVLRCKDGSRQGRGIAISSKKGIWSIEELRQWEPSAELTRGSSPEAVRKRLTEKLEMAASEWDLPSTLVDGSTVLSKQDKRQGRIKIGVSMGRNPNVSIHVAVVDSTSNERFNLTKKAIEVWEQAHRHLIEKKNRPREESMTWDDQTWSFERIDPGDLHDGDLVWFETDPPENISFFGRLKNGRWANLDPLGGRTPSGHQSRTGDELSPADRVFGTAGVGTEDAWAGRLRFGGARFVGDESPQRKWYTLSPLSGPKLSAAGFYLRPDKGNDASWAESGDMLAGSKVYWHAIPDSGQPSDARVALARADEEPAKTSQNATVEACVNGAFETTVWFEDLESVELGALLLSCSLRFTDVDGARGWKMGLGKPLGMGSVENRVDEVLVYGEERVSNPTDPVNGNRYDDAQIRELESDARDYFMPDPGERDIFSFVAEHGSMTGRDIRYPQPKELSTNVDGSRPARPNVAEVADGRGLLSEGEMRRR